MAEQQRQGLSANALLAEMKTFGERQTADSKVLLELQKMVMDLTGKVDALTMEVKVNAAATSSTAIVVAAAPKKKAINVAQPDANPVNKGPVALITKREDWWINECQTNPDYENKMREMANTMTPEQKKKMEQALNKEINPEQRKLAEFKKLYAFLNKNNAALFNEQFNAYKANGTKNQAVVEVQELPGAVPGN